MDIDESIRTIRDHCANTDCARCKYNEKGCYFNNTKPMFWDVPKFTEEDKNIVNDILQNEKRYTIDELLIVKDGRCVYLVKPENIISKRSESFQGMRVGESYTIDEILYFIKRDRCHG